MIKWSIVYLVSSVLDNLEDYKVDSPFHNYQHFSIIQWNLRIRHISFTLTFRMHLIPSLAHNELLVELAKLVFWHKLLSWFQNYLTNRDQKVCSGSSLSTAKPVISGISQGSSILSLVLCFYHLHSWMTFSHIISNPEILLFVDDTKCFHNVSQSSLKTILSNDLNLVVP